MAIDACNPCTSCNGDPGSLAMSSQQAYMTFARIMCAMLTALQDIEAVIGGGSAPFTVANETSVNDSNVDQVLLAANANRKGMIIVNDSTEDLYIRFGNDAATTALYSEKIVAGNTYYMTDWLFTGAVHGIWANDAAGAAKITEFE